MMLESGSGNSLIQAIQKLKFKMRESMLMFE